MSRRLGVLGRKQLTTPAAEQDDQLLRFRVAHHEAAHVVVSERFRLDSAHVVSIVPDDGLEANGFVTGMHTTPPALLREVLAQASGENVERMRRLAEARAMALLAGEIAEWMCQPADERGELGDHLDEQWWDDNPRQDFNCARQSLEPFVPDEDRREQWLTHLSQRTVKLLSQPKMWTAVQQLAAELLRVGTLEGEPLDQAVDALKIPRRWAGDGLAARSRRATARTKEGV